MIRTKTNKELDNKEDLQQLRLAVEAAKLQLTLLPETWIRLNFRSIGKFEYLVIG